MSTANASTPNIKNDCEFTVRTIPEHYDSEQREFDKVIVEAFLAFQDSIDVTTFITEYGWSIVKVYETFNDVLYNHPEIFYVSKSNSPSKQTDADGKITNFHLMNFLYGIDKNDYPRCKVELEREAGKVLAEATAMDDPVRQALVLHDYILRHCEYDFNAAEDNDPSPLARTAYSVLVRRKAVCEGYVMAYRYLMNLAGIPCEEILGDVDGNPHVWNYVKIENDWFHVDITRDILFHTDGSKADIISRDHFLLSDDAIRAKKHSKWSTRGLLSATNHRFDKHTDEDWRNV